MDVTVKITGLKEAQKALYSYSQQMGDRVVRAALRQGANLVLKQARANAPKRTGALKKALRVANSKINNGRKRKGVIGLYLSIRRGKGRGDPRDAFYGKFVESGWQSGQTKVAGQKFVERAYLSQRENAAKLIAQSAIRGAEIVARRTGLK
jgi:HK97 gp10 family phage protein